MKLLTQVIRFCKRKFRSLVGAPVTGYDQQLESARQAYEFYQEVLQENSRINKVVFSGNDAAITLSDGRSFYYDPTTDVNKLYNIPFTGTHEPTETEAVNQIVKSGDVCFDIGANFGWYTTLFSELVDTGEVHAFEPIPQNYIALNKSIELNNITNVVANQIALSEEEGNRKLYVPDIGVSGSFNLHKYQTGYNAYTSEVTTVDQYCDNRSIPKNSIGFIKADIEGAEFAMLRGAEEVIKNSHPRLFLEVQLDSTQRFGYEPQDIFNWLKNREYNIYYIDNRKFVELNEYQAPLPHHNFFIFPSADNLTQDIDL